MGEDASGHSRWRDAAALPRRAEPSNRLCREKALFGLPTLAVDPPVPAAPRLLAEVPDHLAAGTSHGPLARVAAPVQRDHTRAHAQVIAAVAVARLALD